MDNVNFSGEWTGHFRQAENGTEVIFTESISLKNGGYILLHCCI